MAGQDHSKFNREGKITNNGTEPTNQNEEENIVEEYQLLDSTLDDLNSALDYLEQKNDDIHEKLKELLQSNIDIRQQLQSQNTSMDSDETTNN
ncbi:hypothetical protein K1T71_002512 [Dendrolimus kikuchii]|uniref:Uncharacterized protein n=1 Tax=Dendrolimus kikuchii TaxID=765133 RepID=A0ACC1DD82_9NEOP|nr:hypothetical protein K1T71_002512 [Dendrolimus kikuchii]